MSTRTQQPADQGVSIRIDGLASDLAEPVATRNVSGISTNPTIFQRAISHDDGHDRRWAALAAITACLAAHTVNTMPERALHAVAGHADITGDTVTGGYPHARRIMAGLAGAGIDVVDVTRMPGDDGVATFVSSRHGREDAVNDHLNGAATQRGSA